MSVKWSLEESRKENKGIIEEEEEGWEKERDWRRKDRDGE